jgi:Tol biopolymer transport system component/DNA-binding winged helix-turn-helix (wHTH) protein
MTGDTSPQRKGQKLSAVLSGSTRTSRPVRFYEFDRFRIDTKRHLLMRDGEPIAVKPKALDTLILLVQHPGQLLEKEELMTRLWPDTAVEEANLTQNIFVVRKALGEASGEQRFIATVARQGYRFVGDVREVAEGELSRPEDAVDGEGRPVASSGRAGRLQRRYFIYAGLAIVLSLAGASLYLAARRAPPNIDTSPSAAHNLTRLTYGPGLQTDVSWSPDGRRVAYAWDKEANFDIWIQSLDGGEPTRVTSSAADETQPAWSPDGERLVFRSEEDGGGLFTVGVRGGPARRIAKQGLRPVWMPNGRDVMYVIGGQYPFVVGADGSDVPHEILGSELVGGAWFRSAIHPDGRFSVIGMHPVRHFGFFVADRTNSHLNAIDTSAAEPLGWNEPGAIQSIHWTASGRTLFIEAASAGVPSLWRVPVDPVSLAWRTPERLTTGPAGSASAAVSPDGTRLAFTSAQSATRAWLFPFDIDTGRLTGEGRALTDEDVSIAYIHMAADGSAIFYSAGQAGQDKRRLFRTDLINGSTTLVADVSKAGVPSRSGRLVAYVVTRKVERATPAKASSTTIEYALAIRDVGGREHLASAWGPGVMLAGDWARGDDALLGSLLKLAYAGPFALATWPITPAATAGPNRVLLESSGVHFWQARFSPDERWVSFVAQHPQSPAPAEIGIIPATSDRASTWTRIAADHGWPDKPRWSPDGRTLYFLSRGPTGYFNVWGVHIDPSRGEQIGEPFQVTYLGSPRWRFDPDIGVSDFGVADGRLVLPMQSVRGSIWLLSNAGG